MSMKTGFITPDEARQKKCKLAAGKCEANDCILWRWKPLSGTDPDFYNALKGIITEQKMTHKAAVKELDENREKYGVATEPYRGWCGLAGRPDI